MSLKQKLRLSQESDLGSISKALAVGLVSFTRSHANRFDLETLDQDLGTLNIGPDANSSLRELACLAGYIRGPIWVLGPNTSSAGLALSISVNDLAFLWGSISVQESMIETEEGLIVPVKPSPICRENENRMSFHAQNPPPPLPKPLSPECRVLIGSHAFEENPNCVATGERAEEQMAHELANPRYVSLGYAPD